MEDHKVLWFFYNLTLQACLLTSVCHGQNVLSMIHLIFLISFPFFQTTKSSNLNVTFRDGRPSCPRFVKIMFVTISAVTASKLCVMVATTEAGNDSTVDCDDSGQDSASLGFRSDLTPDVLLTILFAVAARYFPGRGRAAPSAVVRASPAGDGHRPSPVPRFSCLAVMCFNGIVAPSYACSVYYGSFLAIVAAIALNVVADKTVGRLFKTICVYTCVHVLALFAYQMEWVRIDRHVGVDLRMAREYGLIAYHALNCYPTEVLPAIQGHHYFLPITLIVQHHMLWVYSNKTFETTSMKRSVNSKNGSTDNMFNLMNIILVVMKTIGFKFVILVWSIAYPGWLTLLLLLCTTISWMYLNTLPNLIFIQFIAISILITEYVYLIQGKELLKIVSGSQLIDEDTHDGFSTSILIKTIFTIIIYITLDQVSKSQPELVIVGPEQWSKNLKKYLSHIWITSLVLIMLTYGFYGYYRINLIQIGYIALSFLFFIVFQVSFKLWRKTIYLYWTIVLLYSNVVVIITYVFQFHGLADILKNDFHISYDLQQDIGLDSTTSYLSIVVPAIIAIAILIYFQYLHGHFKSTLHFYEQPISFINYEEQHKADLETESWFSRIWNTTIIVFHHHINKLEIMLVMVLIMSKPSLPNGILLITMLLWTFFEYNTYIERIMFLQIAAFIFIILGYQFSYFDYDEFQLSIEYQTNSSLHLKQLNTLQINFMEVLGLKKLDKNKFLFDFLTYELLILLIMVLKKSISMNVKLKYYPENRPTCIFPNITYADINNGIPEFLMYLANDGFSLFGLEITIITITIVIALSLDVYALICALWLLVFVVKSRRTISKYWPCLITLIYIAITLKYILLLIEMWFNPIVDMSWNTINIGPNTTITLYDVNYKGAFIKPLKPFDFILLVFASRQLTVFKNETKKRNDQVENIALTAEDEFPDYITQTRSNLDVLKRIIFDNSFWMILFVIFWTGTKNVDLFSLGYLCAGTILFWKGTHYYILPLTTIVKMWNWLLDYSSSVIFLKVFFHLFGCVIFKYFQWYSCIFIRVLSMFCPQRPFEKHQDTTCGASEYEMGLFENAFLFAMILFQKRFFKSGHFARLIEDTKAVSLLANQMYNLVNEWELHKKDESRKVDLDSLKKIKIKLNKIRKAKERHVTKHMHHSQSCLDGEYMFEEVYDDVYFVEKYDTDNFRKHEAATETSSWLYRQSACFVLYVTEKINEFSKEHRHIMHVLNIEKKKLIRQHQMGPNMSSIKLWTSNNNVYHLNNIRNDIDSNKHKHCFKQLILAIINAIQSSTHLLCYFIIFYNAVQNLCDVISIIPVIMVIFWGQLSKPRPTKTFWIVLITYIQITGLVKYICSFKEIPWIGEETKLQQLNAEDFYSYPATKIGIGDYHNKILTDLMVLLILFIHRRSLLRLGLWTYTNDDKKWIVDKKNVRNKTETNTFLRKIILNLEVHFMSITEFFKNLCQYQMEGSVNMYPTMLISIVFQIPCSLLNTRTATESFALNRVSKIILQTFSTYMITIVMDRWFYIRRFVLGKLIFHLFFVTVFILQLMAMENKETLNQLWAYNLYMYIVVSASQIRNGYSYQNASSFFWSQYTMFNLLGYKLYYYCPFVHEFRTVMDWMWTDSSLTIMEWFKMDELFAHVCCVKCICNFRNTLDTERGHKLQRKFKLLIGGGIILAIITVIIFPIAWFSMFESLPDTPSSIVLTIKFGEDSTVFSTKSDDVQRLDSTDFRVMKELYMNSSSSDKALNMAFLQQYEFDELSSINVIPQSINTWPISSYEFNKLKTIIYTSSNIKISVEWSLTHHNSMTISYGKNTVMMDIYEHSELNNCLKSLNENNFEMPGKCKQLVVRNLIPKFLTLHLKSSETEVKSELMIHDPDNPYMDIGLTFSYDTTKFTYWWNMIELCPGDESTIYLKKMPYSSCAENEMKLVTEGTNIMYNIYVFSDRYSSTLQYFDDKGIIGLYTIIVVYFGYKLAFDIFRSFKFKLGYTETPYPDRILQLCYEIYLVRSFEEYEMEEDLYAMLIFLFRSPETLIRYTRMPNQNNMIHE